MATTQQNKVIRVSGPVFAMVKKHASSRGYSVGEAADALIATGHSRLAALGRYSKATKRVKNGKKKKRARA